MRHIIGTDIGQYVDTLSSLGYDPQLIGVHLIKASLSDLGYNVGMGEMESLIMTNSDPGLYLIKSNITTVLTIATRGVPCCNVNIVMMSPTLFTLIFTN